MVRATLELHKEKRYINRTYKPKAEKINKEIYKTTLQNNLEQLQKEPGNNTQEMYNQLQPCILQAAEAASENEPGVRNRHKLSTKTIQLIEQKERLIQLSQEQTGDTREYPELNKRTKREIGKDVRKYNVNLTQKITEKTQGQSKE
jgi:hypothetical protein